MTGEAAATDFDRLRAEVIDQHICLQCGACVGVCPVECIDFVGELQPLPALVPDRKCVDCGLCLEACPREHEFIEEYSEPLFGRTPEPFELAGALRETYSGHATDREVWRAAAGGGLVSGLSIFMLESGLVDGVIMCGMSSAEPWRVEPKIVTTREEVQANASSHYVTVPLLRMLRQTRGQPRKRYALVGSGCHVNAIRNLQLGSAGGAESVSQIMFTIGLMCGGNRVPAYTRQLLADMGVDDVHEVASFSFRGGEGSSAVASLKTGEVRQTRGHFGSDIRRLDPLYEAGGCTLCIDFFANLADVTVGDYTQKQSVLFVRSETGANVVSEAVAAGYVDLDPTVYDFDGRRQDRIRHDMKKRVAFTLLDQAKRSGRPHPNYGASSRDPVSYWRSDLDRRFFLLVRWLAHLSIVRRLYQRIPIRLQWGFGVLWAGRQLYARETWPSWSGFFGKLPTTSARSSTSDAVLERVLARQRAARANVSRSNTNDKSESR